MDNGKTKIMKNEQAQSSEQRVIRIFISSTFRDMQEERDELVKRIFPQLRKLCEKRGVVWGEVDLRWGITDEETSEGKVLPVCLEEIHRCRPYFIGILGERYGWLPNEIPQELIEKENWLKQHLDKSVTELEILHGVLNNPEMKRHAYFYFRDPAYIDSMPPDKQEDFYERPIPEDIKQFGYEEAQCKTEERIKKLTALKDKIRRSGLPFRENYKNPQELGQLVLDDLTAVINNLYPEGSEPDPLDHLAFEHETFAQSRFKIYIGRREYFETLDKHARDETPPLVILGESGSGKSALLSNWSIEYRRKNPDELFVMHFIGSTPEAADWMSMLRRIMGEMKRRFDIPGDIPDKPDALRMAFANCLHIASVQGRVILIIDALNQLEDRDGAPDLVWLPSVIPENIRLILSTLPGRSLDELNKRDWQKMQIHPLDNDERIRLINEFLEMHCKKLSRKQIEKIASAEQTRNPLYLRSLLEELRVFGEYEELNKRIEECLAARTIPALFEAILKRCEDDYERDRHGLVRDSMTLIWSARRGLTETEILEVLGQNGNPLPQAIWAPFSLAIEQALVSHSGYIQFCHDYMRQAVRNRFIPTDKAQQETHLTLADYFAEFEFNNRVIDEYPWQLIEAKSWERLHCLLSNLEFFTKAWVQNQFDLKSYWSKVEEFYSVKKKDTYLNVLSNPQNFNTDTVRFIAALLSDTGDLIEALSLLQFLTEHFRKIGDLASLHASMVEQGKIKSTHSEWDDAMKLYKEAEQICREIDDMWGLCKSLYNQAKILHYTGDYEEAMRLFKETELICREIGDKPTLQACLGAQGVMLRIFGKIDESLKLHKEAERICREIGDKQLLSATINNQANILAGKGKFDESLILHKEAECIYRELGDKLNLSSSLTNQGGTFFQQGELDNAMRLFKEAEQVCREIGHKPKLSLTLNNQGSILKNRGQLNEAMKLFKEAEQISREIEDKKQLHNSLCNQGNVLIDRGELDEAMKFFKESELICRELGHKRGLIACLNSQGKLYFARGEFDIAMEFFMEIEQLSREAKDKWSLATGLNNQSEVFLMRGEFDKAMDLSKEAERISREIGQKETLAVILLGQSKALAIRGKFNEAMVLLKEMEQICNELKLPELLAFSYAAQASILLQTGKTDEGLLLAKEAQQIASNHGYKAILEETESILDKFLSQPQ